MDAVIWATGYRPDYSWLDVPVIDAQSRVRHRRGLTDLPGLYFLGLYWQWTRGSALIGWVRDDAEYIAQQIEAYEQKSVAPCRGQASETETEVPRTRIASRRGMASPTRPHQGIEGEFPTATEGLPEAQPSERLDLLMEARPCLKSLQ